LGKISYTSDTWSSKNLQSFHAITAHWAYRDETDDTIKLKARLIAFHRIQGCHTADNMAQITVDLLDRAGSTAKAGHIYLSKISLTCSV
jgi:hypothetical protein